MINYNEYYYSGDAGFWKQEVATSCFQIKIFPFQHELFESTNTPFTGRGLREWFVKPRNI
jgi:hypothetical protein